MAHSSKLDEQSENESIRNLHIIDEPLTAKQLANRRRRERRQQQQKLKKEQEKQKKEMIQSCSKKQNSIEIKFGATSIEISSKNTNIDNQPATIQESNNINTYQAQTGALNQQQETNVSHLLPWNDFIVLILANNSDVTSIQT